MAKTHYDIPRPFRARIDRTKKGAANRAGRKRFLKRLRRTYRLLARRTMEKRHSRILLDALTPVTTISASRSSSLESKRIAVENFSLVDYPEKTMVTLSEIAKADREGNEYFIDFVDEYCLDIGPYLVFGLMRQEMERICKGGKIAPHIARVLGSVGMTQFLDMQVKTYFPSREEERIFPFHLNRHSAIQRYTSGFESHRSAKEKHAQRFADSLNSWLSAAQMELSIPGGDRVRSMIAEILDNSRHANPSGDDGEWAMAGFMTSQKGPNGQELFLCHLAIASIGKTISETLLDSEDEQVRDNIEKYVSAHVSKDANFNGDTLRAVCALIDRISCEGTLKNKDLGGCGMSSLIVMLQTLGSESILHHEPRITIISGKSCIRLRKPYNIMISQNTDGLGPYFQAFNEEQDLAVPPDQGYVYELEQRFPGTVIALKFTINSEELQERVANANKERKS